MPVPITVLGTLPPIIDGDTDVRRLAPINECIAALGCTVSEWNTLDSADRLELWWDYCETLPWEPLAVFHTQIA